MQINSLWNKFQCLLTADIKAVNDILKKNYNKRFKERIERRVISKIIEKKDDSEVQDDDRNDL